MFSIIEERLSIHICDCQIGDRDVRDFIYKYYVYMQGSSVEGIHNFFVASKWLSNPSSLGNLGPDHGLEFCEFGAMY